MIQVDSITIIINNIDMMFGGMMGLIEIIIIILVIGGLAGGGFSFFKVPIILLTNYTLNEEGQESQGELFEIQGNKSGIIAWLLDVLGIRSREVRFLFFKESVVKIEGKDTFERMPTRDIYSSTIGYSNNKFFLIISIILLLLTTVALVNFLDSGYDGILGQVITFGFLSWLFFFLYKRSSMIGLITKTANGNSIGVNIKKGIQSVSEEDMEKIKNIVHNSIEESSRFYNSHYVK